MKKHYKLTVLLLIIVGILANTVVIIQPKYNHYVIGLRYPNVRFVYSGSELVNISVSNRDYIHLNEDDEQMVEEAEYTGKELLLMDSGYFYHIEAEDELIAYPDDKFIIKPL